MHDLGETEKADHEPLFKSSETCWHSPTQQCLPSTLCVLQRSKQLWPLSMEAYSLAGVQILNS